MTTIEKRKILVSACLLGEEVRYDATGASAVGDLLRKWKEEGRIVMVCPEVAGGLPVPRPPAEQQPDGSIITVHGDDVTEAFETGARHAVSLARRHDVAFAVLKARSPSCGSLNVYDGTFSGVTVEGAGATTLALRAAGYRVFSEERLTEAAAFLDEVETAG